MCGHRGRGAGVASGFGGQAHEQQLDAGGEELVAGQRAEIAIDAEDEREALGQVGGRSRPRDGRCIRSVRRVDMGVWSGKGRIWGTGNPRYWASLDPRRPWKEAALILDLGRPVQPFITPDDPDAVERAIHAHVV